MFVIVDSWNILHSLQYNTITLFNNYVLSSSLIYVSKIVPSEYGISMMSGVSAKIFPFPLCKTCRNIPLTLYIHKYTTKWMCTIFQGAKINGSTPFLVDIWNTNFWYFLYFFHLYLAHKRQTYPWITSLSYNEKSRTQKPRDIVWKYSIDEPCATYTWLDMFKKKVHLIFTYIFIHLLFIV